MQSALGRPQSIMYPRLNQEQRLLRLIRRNHVPSVIDLHEAQPFSLFERPYLPLIHCKRLKIAGLEGRLVFPAHVVHEVFLACSIAIPVLVPYIHENSVIL